jgi:tetratricopeptide (TPR) repeat protein
MTFLTIQKALAGQRWWTGPRFLSSDSQHRGETGDYRGAAEAQEEALDIYRAISHRGGQANALTDLGSVRRVTGDHRGAAEALEKALDISREISYRHGEVQILNETGALYRVRGDPIRAAEYHRQALTLARVITSLRDEACALAALGRCALALGRASDAAENLRQARDIFQRIGAPEAADVAAELDTLTEPRQGSPELGQGTSQPY